MKAEINDQDKIDAIKEFLGLSEFQLINTNKANDKDYAITYRAFKDHVQLPPDYILWMCSSDYFNHFYDQHVIEEENLSGAKIDRERQ